MAEREQPLLSGPNGAPNSYLVSPKKSCSFAYAQLVFRDCTDYVLTSGWRLRNRRSGINRPMKGERRKTLIVVSQRPVNGSIRLLCASTGLHVTGKSFLFLNRAALFMQPTTCQMQNQISVVTSAKVSLCPGNE